jgi:hypothetical protein
VQRVVKGIPSTLTLATSLKATAGTVTITRDRDSSVIVNAQAVTCKAQAVSYTLPAQSGEANLTAVWTLSTASGTMTVSEPVEVVSFESCSLAEMRARRPLDDVNRYPDALLIKARTELENELNARAGVNFVGGEFTVTVDAPHSRELFLPIGRPQSLSSVVINGAALSASDVADIVIDPRSGSLWRRWGWHIYGIDGWLKTRMNITITGVSGFSQPVGGLSNAIAKGVRHMVVDSPTSDRATSISNEDGTTQNLIVAGYSRGAMFGIPELNTLVEQNRTTFGVA